MTDIWYNLKCWCGFKAKLYTHDERKPEFCPVCGCTNTEVIEDVFLKKAMEAARTSCKAVRE